MIHLYVNMFFFIFFSIMVYHRILNIVCCAIREDLVHASYMRQFASAHPKQPVQPSPTALTLGSHQSLHDAPGSGSVSQTGSFVSYFGFHV